MICILLIEVTLAAISPLLSSVIFFVVQMKKVGFGSFRVEAEKKKMEEGERKWVFRKGKSGLKKKTKPSNQIVGQVTWPINSRCTQNNAFTFKSKCRNEM